MLRPTFYSFETAKRALASSQMGLDTVGHNISNVNTPGYTRQRVDQVTFNLGYGRTQFSAFGHFFPGQGAEVSGINQIRDPYLDRRFRTEAAKVGELGTVSGGLDKLNLIFDEIQKTGSHAKMSEFLTELDSLIASADSPEQATVLRSKAQDLARVLNKNSIDLANAATQQQEEMEASVDSINVLLEQIADLNVKIKEDNFFGNPSNENNDLRNLYIDQLSELVDIDIIKTPVEVTPDFSVESVKIAIKGSKPPAVLVDSSLYNAIDIRYQNPLKPNKDKQTYEYLDEVSYHLVDGMTKLPILKPGERVGDGDITDQIMTGALKGHLDIMNGKGTDAEAGESVFRGIPYTQKALDDYARVLADEMNKLNAVQIWNPTLDGTGGFVSIPRDLFVASGATSDVTEFTHMGSVADPLNPGSYLPQIQASMLDGRTLDATAWRFVDPETGNILDVKKQPINDPLHGTPLNIKDIERKLTARNIATSQAWQDDPLYITRETLNSAIYTGPSTPGGLDGGTLKIRKDDGSMTDTLIPFGDVVSIGAGGTLIGADGKPIQFTGKDLTLDMLQKAMTEEAPKTPGISDFFGTGAYPPGDAFTFNRGHAPLVAADFVKRNADGTYAAVDAGDNDIDQWRIDEEGVLMDAGGNRLYLASDTDNPKKLFNVSGLVKQVQDVTMTGVPPTFKDYFPNGVMGKTLTITEKNPDGTTYNRAYTPGDFGPGKYESFEGWSINDDGELLDQAGDPVYRLNDIALNESDLELQPEYEKGRNYMVRDYLNEDGDMVFEGGTAHAPGDFGPGINEDGDPYASFAGWTINDLNEIRDADGNRVYLQTDKDELDLAPPPPITIKDDPKNNSEIGLKQWNFPMAPSSITDFLSGSPATSFIQRTNSTETYGPGAFIGEGGKTYTDFTDWSFDNEGYLIDGPYIAGDPDASGKRVSLTGDPYTMVRMSDLKVITDPAPHYNIGDPTPNDLLPGEKANGNLDQMKIMLTEPRTFPNGFKGNFQEYLIGFQEDLANDKQTNDSLLSGTVNVLNGLADSRDGISAVSIDEEGITMMTYQNYYNAASRYMTTLDEALDKIINGMGTVGR